MPIVFVHGVTVRDHNREHVDLWRRIEALLRSTIAPVISPNPGRVAIISAYWGDIGTKLHWGGASLPPTPAAPTLVEHPVLKLLGQWPPDAAAGEWWRRIQAAPGNLLARAVAPARAQLSTQILVFLGDIVSYFHHREAIIARVREKLLQARQAQEAAGGEPLVVLSHSMGGQIVYDLVTSYLPEAAGDRPVRIDFWAAAASQVGLFEEMKLFRASAPQYQLGTQVPFPDRRYLGAWWNVWDPNDMLSFTTQSIIADVDDTPYPSELALHEAHTDILTLPSFYAMFAERLTAALARGR